MMKFFKGIDWKWVTSGDTIPRIHPDTVERCEKLPHLNPNFAYSLITKPPLHRATSSEKLFMEHITPHCNKIESHPHMSGTVLDILKTQQLANHDAFEKVMR